MQRLAIAELLAAYRARRYSPTQLIEQVLSHIEQAPERGAWITRLSRQQVFKYVQALESRTPETAPLYGIPFAIKDNIDLANVPTTAACKAFAYTPSVSAAVVQKLIDAGAIPIGKTNLDQFATGLVGTRSDFGACLNSFNSDYISGGSSSGSAVAVATGAVSFSLGTDTAGSGRVPAAFNNIVGLKPSLGRLSTRGVVPACRTLDCVSIFALSAADAAAVLSVAEGYDEADAYSRSILDDTAPAHTITSRFRFGVPPQAQLNFFGDQDYARLYAQAITRLEELGGQRVEIDFAPFLETARLLYEGPWVAERYAAIEQFMQTHRESMQSITAQIIAGGANVSAVAAFRAQYQLQSLKRQCAAAMREIDVIVTPTAGTIYRIDQVNNDPIKLNTNLGYYTNYVNLLDLAALAVPAGFRNDGLPFGVTLVGPSGSDRNLLALGARLHRADLGLGALGISGVSLPDASIPVMPENPPTLRDRVAVAVCGAHMEGLPLNHLLTTRGGSLLRRTHTAPLYSLFALSGGSIKRPGLVRRAAGAAIEVEVWSLPLAQFGSFVAEIPAPLGVGKVLLNDGEQVTGFLCESYAITDAIDITALGGWRAYLATLAQQTAIN